MRVPRYALRPHADYNLLLCLYNTVLHNLPITYLLERKQIAPTKD